MRRITKPGPTGLITTSTRPLPHQLDTRTLTVTVADTPGQTRDVMRAHAVSLNKGQHAPDVADFIALQTWLELDGNRGVVVPLAGALAEIVPADHVRMRRDFRQLLTMIEAVAMLHQCQRETDADGRIIATLDDYERARTLLLDVFQTAASGGVTRVVRETVDAVNRIYRDEPLTNQAIADVLRLSKDTAWYRIRRAIKLGYLSNDEKQKGRPAKVRPADPLPDDRPALPTVTEVMARVLDRPTPDSTVQPPGADESAFEADDVVEGVVESAVQPPVQLEYASVSASRDDAALSQVERLKPESAAEHMSGPTEEWEDIRV